MTLKMWPSRFYRILGSWHVAGSGAETGPNIGRKSRSIDEPLAVGCVDGWPWHCNTSLARLQMARLAKQTR